MHRLSPHHEQAPPRVSGPLRRSRLPLVDAAAVGLVAGEVLAMQAGEVLTCERDFRRSAGECRGRARIEDATAAIPLFSRAVSWLPEYGWDLKTGVGLAGC